MANVLRSKVVTLQRCYMAKLPNCKVVTLQCCHLAMLSLSNVVTLQPAAPQLGSFHLGNFHLESRPWENALEKIPEH